MQSSLRHRAAERMVCLVERFERDPGSCGFAEHARVLSDITSYYYSAEQLARLCAVTLRFYEQGHEEGLLITEDLLSHQHCPAKFVQFWENELWCLFDVDETVPFRATPSHLKIATFLLCQEAVSDEYAMAAAMNPDWAEIVLNSPVSKRVRLVAALTAGTPC